MNNKGQDRETTWYLRFANGKVRTNGNLGIKLLNKENNEDERKVKEHENTIIK